MKKFCLCVYCLLIVASLNGCLKEQEAMGIEIEAGNNDLIDVICSFEDVLRIGDTNYLIRIIDNDEWDPFNTEKIYTVKYEKVSLAKDKKEEKVLSITIIDTYPPTINKRPGIISSTVSYSNDMEKMRETVMNIIDDSFVVVDNSSMSPMVLNEENLTLDPFDNCILNEPQIICFHVSDPSGNVADGSIELIFRGH